MFADFEITRFLFWCTVNVSAGLFMFHATAYYYHRKYYVKRADEKSSWKIQTDKSLREGLPQRAFWTSTFNLVYGGLLTAVVIYAVELGFPNPIYFEVSDYGWAYTIFSTILFFFMIEGAAYYVHRLTHHEKLYKHFHKEHHTYIATTPYVTVAIHPVVFTALQLSTFIPVFILPLHVVSIAFVFVYVFIFNIISHSGVDLKSVLPWQASARYHDDHHAYFHVNFGQHITFFDRIHGTLRRDGQTYGPAVFGGKGERAVNLREKVKQDKEDFGDFVKY